jgi:Flp pilus assembly protein TadG
MRVQGISRTTQNDRPMRRRSCESGQAVVELALVLPIMLLLLMGIVQFGSVFRDYIALTDATRAGARQGSVARSLSGTDQAKIDSVVATVQKAAVNLKTSNVGTTVTLQRVATPNIDCSLGGPTSCWEQGGTVTVRTTYPFKLRLAGMVFFSGVLQSRTVERIE